MGGLNTSLGEFFFENTLSEPFPLTSKLLSSKLHMTKDNIRTSNSAAGDEDNADSYPYGRLNININIDFAPGPNDQNPLESLLDALADLVG